MTIHGDEMRKGAQATHSRVSPTSGVVGSSAEKNVKFARILTSTVFKAPRYLSRFAAYGSTRGYILHHNRGQRDTAGQPG